MGELPELCVSRPLVFKSLWISALEIWANCLGFPYRNSGWMCRSNRFSVTFREMVGLYLRDYATGTLSPSSLKRDRGSKQFARPSSRPQLVVDDGEVGEVAVTLPGVQPVSDHERIRNLMAKVSYRNSGLARGGALTQEGTDFEAAGIP